jgi:hypothetical protein
VKEPVKPSFLTFKAKKEKMEQERLLKINYENSVLLKKIIDIEKKPSPYNPSNLQVGYCPAYDKNYYLKNKKKFDLDKDNLVSRCVLIIIRNCIIDWYLQNHIIRQKP